MKGVMHGVSHQNFDWGHEENSCVIEKVQNSVG